MTEKKAIPCYCENIVEIEVPTEVDLAADPDGFAAIREGRFLTATCPRCGKLLKPEFPVRILDSSKGLEIFFVPELERGAYLMGRSPYAVADGTHGRIVIGYPELVEKLAICEAGLDDRAVELIKYYLAQKASDSSALEIYFKRREGDKLTFHLHGLREGEVGVSTVPDSLYQKVLSELPEKEREEPFDYLMSPPYVSYKKVAGEDFA